MTRYRSIAAARMTEQTVDAALQGQRRAQYEVHERGPPKIYAPEMASGLGWLRP